MKISSHSKCFTVRLHETDLGAIVHHSNYFHWIEETEYAFFEAIDEPVIGELDENKKGTGWPRADMQVKFIKPLRFRDKIRVDLSIKKIRSAGIIYEVEIYKITSDSPELVLKGSYSAICCLYSSDGESDPEVIPIPDHFLKKISTQQPKE